MAVAALLSKNINMEVSLVSITDSAILDNDGRKLTPEELIVYTARASNPSNQLNTGSAHRLLHYLIEHKHWSPFDMCNMTVAVKTSRAIAQQILRHWSIKPQEFSQRYAEATAYEPIELRLKADTNRQSSTDVVATIESTGQRSDAGHIGIRVAAEKGWGRLADRYAAVLSMADELYRDAIAAGIAAECARFILPLCTQTTLYLNGSVRSWIHYLQQRTDQHAQKEHRLVAEGVKTIFAEHFPQLTKAIFY